MNHERRYWFEDKILYYGSALLTPELRRDGRFIEVGGARFLVRAKSGMDSYIIDEEFIEKKYDCGIHKGHIVVDVGASFGPFSVDAAQKCAYVIALEPHPENNQLLKINCYLNNVLSQVTVSDLALAGHSGQRTFHVSSANTGGHSFFETGAKKTIQVQTTTLEELMRLHNLMHIDVLKIDAEGAEGEILMESPKDVLQRIQTIVMEDHVLDQRYQSGTLPHYLVENGFTVNRRTYADHFLHKTGIIIAKRK